MTGPESACEETVARYLSRYDPAAGGDAEARRRHYQTLVNDYYDLVTDNNNAGRIERGRRYAREAAGFALEETKDRAREGDPGCPWYGPLEGSERILRALPRRPLGRKLTGLTLSLLEPPRIVPRGTCAVSGQLNAAADALVAAGHAGIFTPMLFFKVRKR